MRNKCQSSVVVVFYNTVNLLQERCRWFDNIKMDGNEIDCDNMNWICVAEEGIQWMAASCEHSNEHCGLLSGSQFDDWLFD
jgi:hypothetical protein